MYSIQQVLMHILFDAMLKRGKNEHGWDDCVQPLPLARRGRRAGLSSGPASKAPPMNVSHRELVMLARLNSAAWVAHSITFSSLIRCFGKWSRNMELAMLRGAKPGGPDQTYGRRD